MNRRRFVAASLGVSAFPFGSWTKGVGKTESTSATVEYYDFRRYQMTSGPGTKLTDTYFADVLVPALNRLGIGPVGAFSVYFGPETPAFYLLMPSSKLETLVTADLLLARDPAFVKAAESFWDAPAGSPPYIRIESSLLRAFEGYPRVSPPASAATKGKRIYQLRQYQSPTNADHVRKVEMFHAGEFEIFLNAGFHPVFFGDTLLGSRLPNLTYMLSFADQGELEAKWNVFRNDPAWKKLSTSPRYSSDQLVTNITNLILSPLDCSQI